MAKEAPGRKRRRSFAWAPGQSGLDRTTYARQILRGFETADEDTKT